MNRDKNYCLCSQCKQTAGQLYVEWSSANETVEGPAITAELERDGCVAEMFCSWGCAARWFQSQADLHPQQ